MKVNRKPEIEVLQQALRKIQYLSNALTPEDPKVLETKLDDLISKISALRSFIRDHLIREEKRESRFESTFLSAALNHDETLH
jgi:nitrate reductase beta subunit